MADSRIQVGVFGGSGFYELLDDATEVKVDTPYGPPSAPVVVGEIGGRAVGFLPRHGVDHSLPPHAINYRANVWAMKQLGATDLILPCAAGSLQRHVEPGHFVICDQVVDRTSGRADTFYDGPETTHVSFAEPYDAEMRATAVASARKLGIPVHDGGTVVVIQGPRFSTKAESRWFSAAGWEVINMTQYPEVILARELEMAALNISLITDYDAGLEDDPDVEAVSHEGVLAVFQQNNGRLRDLLFDVIPALPLSPTARPCPPCAAPASDRTDPAVLPAVHRSAAVRLARALPGVEAAGRDHDAARRAAPGPAPAPGRPRRGLGTPAPARAGRPRRPRPPRRGARGRGARRPRGAALGRGTRHGPGRRPRPRRRHARPGAAPDRPAARGGPPGSVASVPDGAALAIALPQGVVLTAAHLDPRGPAAGLEPGLRAVPVPVEDGWAVAPGGFVDVWVLGAEDGTAGQVAASRAVLEVADAQDGAGRTALLALREDEVAATTAGLALGRVLLTHAPAP